MLGLLKSKNSWTWASCGKHPAAKDYFLFQVEAPLMVAFSEWVEKGYREFTARNKKAYRRSSWRFWVRGLKPGDLLCGVLKDSSDSIGRPYPLLVMGGGTIKGWENGWVFLFQVFKNIWDQIEYISARRFDGLDQLENEIDKLQKPAQTGLDITPAEQSDLWGEEVARIKVLQLKENRELWVPLDEYSSVEPFTAAEMWSASLERQGGGTPNALFMGGTPERPYLSLFQRSLNTADFSRLWSLEEGGDL